MIGSEFTVTDKANLSRETYFAIYFLTVAGMPIEKRSSIKIEGTTLSNW